MDASSLAAGARAAHRPRVEFRVEIRAPGAATAFPHRLPMEPIGLPADSDIVGGVGKNPSIVLKRSGLHAEIEPDRYVPGAYQLVIDGTPQSHVDLEDPSRLFFEYTQRMGHVIDLAADPGAPITAVHLGGGGLTLPRYIAATRPGSRQQVVELESDLVDFVRTHLPLPRRSQIRIRHGDARAVLNSFPAGLHGVVDILVVDVFSGARIPAHLTSIEFYVEAIRMLAPTGILLVNLADGPPLTFARGQLSTHATALPEVAALAEMQVLKGRRFGNIVAVASAKPLPLELMPRLMTRGPHPAKVVAASELRSFLAGAHVVTDATAVQSPEPIRSVFI